MSPDRPVTRQTRVTRLTKLTNKTDQTIREGRCKNCQQCKIANLQTRQTRVTRLTRLTRLTRQYERGGARIFKHGKLPISSFVQPVSQSHTIISATDAGASENDFSDTIETKAVVVISLDSPGLLIDPKSQKKMSCGLLEAIWVQIHHSLKYAGVPRCLFSIRPRQMIGKTRVCRGKD